MKILYVSQYFPPEIGAPSARVSELSQRWVKGGHHVTVLTGFPNYPTGIVPAAYRSRLWRLVFREKMQGVRVVRTWLLPLPNRKAVGRMLNFASFCISSATVGLLLSRPDVVIATSPQLLVALSGWWLARCKRVPFVFEVRDLWPESLVAVGIGKNDSLLYRVLNTVAGFLYRQCDHVVVVTAAFKEHLVKFCGVPAEKISVVENGVETGIFRPQTGDRNSGIATNLRHELQADGRFLVCYIGAMGMAHGLDTLLETAVELQTANPRILFLLLGEGAEKERILALARSRGLTNLRIVDQQPREKIPDYIRAADACLVLLKKSPLFKTVIPTKMLEYMSCARPVILGVDGQARNILEDANAGIYVEPENAGHLARAIIRLAEDPGLCELLGNSGRRHILRHFSREQMAGIYIGVLTTMKATNPVAISTAA